MTIDEQITAAYEAASQADAGAVALCQQAAGLDERAAGLRRQASSLRRKHIAERDRAYQLGLIRDAITAGGVLFSVTRKRYKDSETEPCAIVKVTPKRIRAVTLIGDVEFERFRIGWCDAGDARGDHRGAYTVDVDGAVKAWEERS